MVEKHQLVQLLNPKCISSANYKKVYYRASYINLSPIFILSNLQINRSKLSFCSTTALVEINK